MERRVAVCGRPLAPRDAAVVVHPRRPIDPADPFPALVDAWLRPGAPRARWAIARGSEAKALAALDDAEQRHASLVVRSGHATTDRLLDELAPVLGRLLDDLTMSQRRIARPMLADGLRQADVAEALGISRASVSVAHRRAHLPELDHLLRAMRAAWRDAGLATVDRGDTVPR